MDDAILTDSGTSALVLALKAVTRPGDTVAYPAYACIDLTTAALAAGLRVRLYDLDPATLSPQLDSVRAVVGRGVNVIVVAHLFGYPADVSGVRTIADAHGIPVIEDAAQGAGGALHSQPLGGCGDLSILSFGRGKGLTAGSGGALLARTATIVEKVKLLARAMPGADAGGKELLTLAAQLLFARPSLYRIPASVPALKLGEMIFHPPHEPRPMTTAAVSLLENALSLDDDEVAGRKLRAQLLLARAGSCPSAKPVRSIPGGDPGYLRFAMLTAPGGSRPPACLGSARGYPLTLDEQSQLRPILHSAERAGKGASLLRDTLFTLPTHSLVRGRHLSRLTDWLGARDVASDSGLSPARAW